MRKAATQVTKLSRGRRRTGMSDRGARRDLNAYFKQLERDTARASPRASQRSSLARASRAPPQQRQHAEARGAPTPCTLHPEPSTLTLQLSTLSQKPLTLEQARLRRSSSSRGCGCGAARYASPVLGGWALAGPSRRTADPPSSLSTARLPSSLRSAVSVSGFACSVLS